MRQDRWQVLLAENIDPVGPESIADIADCTSVSSYDSVEDLKHDINRYHGVIDRHIPLSRDLLEAADRLQVVAKHGVGVDNIDINVASERGIVVCNTPGSNGRSVAEHTLALLLAVRKRIVEADRHVRSGQWDRQEFSAPELGGDTLGLFGCGNIGSIVARFADALDMDVVIYDPYVDAADLPDMVTSVDTKQVLFERSDVVSIHVPLTEETRHTVSTAELAALGTGGILVNTARGPVVDEDALIKSLESDIIAGAGLDVLKSEPPTGDNPLLDRPDVVLTPHYGGLSVDALREASFRAARSIRDVYVGNLPDGVLNVCEVDQFRFEC